MTDQPTQDAIVSQRARDLTQAILDCWFNRSVIEAKIEAFQAEIEASTIERCAGVAIDEKVDALATQEETDAAYNAGIDDAVEAIRNLKGQTS